MPVPSRKILRLILGNFLVRKLTEGRWAFFRERVPARARRWFRRMLEKPMRQGIKFIRTPEWYALEGSATADLTGKEASTGPLSTHPGVNLYGYFSRWLGLGECARLYANAMIASGYPVSLHDVELDIPHARSDRTLAAHMTTTPTFTHDLIFVNPDYWEATLSSIGAAASVGHYVIGYWFWELDQFPDDWRQAFDQVDEVMVSSTFVERAMSRVCDKPVTRVPLPVVAGPDSGLQRQHFGLRSDDYVFLCAFDFNSTVARKNPHAAIEAFREAFPHGDEKVALLIKTSNGEANADELVRLLVSAARDRRILIRDDMLERHHLQALHRCADAYVSLHRCEGFGLGMAEAMCLGKPVVATAYSGNMDFMSEANSCLVRYSMIPVQPGQYPHAEGQQWADADITHAAGFLRGLYDDPEMGRKLGSQAARDMAENFSIDACIDVIARRLRATAHELDDVV